MRILVTPNEMKVLEKNHFNENEYEVRKLIFEYKYLDDVLEFAQKIVYITTPSNQTYTITDYIPKPDGDYFIIPLEALKEVGTIEIGMVLEEWYSPIRGEGERVLVSRFSPSPVYARVHKGSYKQV